MGILQVLVCKSPEIVDMVSGGGGVDGYGNNQVQETWL